MKQTATLIALVLTTLGAGCGGNDKQGGTRLAGTYARKDNPQFYLELKADGSFYHYSPIDGGTAGKYSVDGDTITAGAALGLATRFTVKGETLVEEHGTVWVRQTSAHREEAARARREGEGEEPTLTTKPQQREWRGRMYQERTHEALVALEKAVQGVGALRHIRTTAEDLRRALSELQTAGDGATIEWPKPQRLDTSSALSEIDAKLFVVFGVNPEAVLRIVRSKNAGIGRARSARLRWNRQASTGALARDVAAVPDRIRELRESHEQIAVCMAVLQHDEVAAEAAAQLLLEARKNAYRGAERATLEGEAAKLGSLLAHLKAELELLAPYRELKSLGDALSEKFAAR